MGNRLRGFQKFTRLHRRLECLIPARETPGAGQRTQKRTRSRDARLTPPSPHM